MQTYRARRVLRAERRGSSWPVVIDTDAGSFFTKLRGAAQAPASLVAEIIVGALADAIGLSVPARVLIEIPPLVETDDRRDELLQLLEFSAGLNVGFQYLPGVRDFQVQDTAQVDPRTASTIVWLDGLVLNPDRTPRNPNLLWQHDRLWLIDHGACLGFQHDWSAVTERSPRLPGPAFENHVLHARATVLGELDSRLAGLLDRSVLEAAVSAVPAAFLGQTDSEGLRRRRAAYVAFLRKRLVGPRLWGLGAGR